MFPQLSAAVSGGDAHDPGNSHGRMESSPHGILKGGKTQPVNDDLIDRLAPHFRIGLFLRLGFLFDASCPAPGSPD